MRKTILMILFAVASAQAAVPHLRTYREIYDGLRVTNNNPKPDAQLEALYNSLKESLPKTGGVAEYSPPTQMATARLAGAFCQRMIAIDANTAPDKRWAHRLVDFTKGPKAMTKEMRLDTINNYASLYWQGTPSPAEADALIALFDSLTTAQPDTVAGLREVLLGVCAASASSLGFLTL